MNVRNKIKARKITIVLVIIGFLAIFIHIIHALTLDRIIQYKEISFYSPNVHADMNGYRIAFIADTHTLPEDYLRDIVEKLNNKQIDLLALGGDYHHDYKEVRLLMEILSQVEAKDRIFGIEGNHDNYAELFTAMEAHGILPLSNSGVRVREHFYIAGVEDLWNRSPDIGEAISGANEEDFVLLLAHNPDVTMLQDTTGVDLILSGHTHAGQITFFGIWGPYFALRRSITAYGQRFRTGWAVSRDNTPVYISNGTAIRYYHIPRVFARPQVIIITLFSE